jgi:hypothetical protein
MRQLEKRVAELTAILEAKDVARSTKSSAA